MSRKIHLGLWILFLAPICIGWELKSVIGLFYFDLVMREGAMSRSWHWVSVFNDGFGIKVEEFRDKGIECGRIVVSGWCKVVEEDLVMGNWNL